MSRSSIVETSIRRARKNDWSMMRFLKLNPNLRDRAVVVGEGKGDREQQTGEVAEVEGMALVRVGESDLGPKPV